MRNVFKRTLTQHAYSFTNNVIQILCSDESDRDFLVSELIESASNMNFLNYEFALMPDNKTLFVTLY